MAEPAPTAPRQRLAGIDLLRGLVMVVMLLDHTRDFVHATGLTADPLARGAGGGLFFTRWVTHFCAPTFLLLAGLSARLQLARGLTRGELAGWLLRRGLFLIAVELVVLRPLIWFDLDLSFLAFLQVIFAIGVAMCGLAVLLALRLPATAIGLLGLLLVAAHNLVSNASFVFVQAPSWPALELLLLGRGGMQFGGGGGWTVIVQYALLPWLGMLLLGFWLGAVYGFGTAARRVALFALGIGACTAFVWLRAAGLYGDPDAWRPDAAWPESLFGFLRVAKYPPSLHYALMTLGPALVALAVFDRVRSDGPWRVVVALGRVPLFFYVLQWPTVHLVSRLLQWLDGQPVGWDGVNVLQLGNALPAGCGFGLPMVYVAWAIGLVVLVPLSLWFARVKARNPQRRWLSYL
jgi:uncharacterized membrane protein